MIDGPVSDRGEESDWFAETCGFFGISGRGSRRSTLGSATPPFIRPYTSLSRSGIAIPPGVLGRILTGPSIARIIGNWSPTRYIK